MRYILALVAGAAGAALGVALGAAAGLLIASATGMANAVGEAAVFALFVCGPVGGLLGLGLGVWLAVRRRGFAAFAAHLGTTVVGLGGIAGAALYLAFGMQTHVNPNGAAPRLMFEIRLPPGAIPPPREGTIELHTSKNRMPARIAQAARTGDDGRPVVEGHVEMAYNVSQRSLILKMGDKGDVVFKINLSGVPKHSKTLGPWRPADHIFEPGKDRARPATAADAYEIRYRAAWAGED
ncbi:MAG: hypothetical protein FJX62_05990 [Alphaproteobacteria bacterium]|nr:hypothetical protein [Alphaproteobacteria bacterium]